MFRVAKRQCSTCIYRPESPLDLRALEDAVRDPHMGFRGHRVCHHSPEGGDVCCRGFWEAHKNEFPAGQIAQRLNVVKFIEVEKEIPMSFKNQMKREKRLARRAAPESVMRPAYHFHSRYAGMNAEEIDRAVALDNARALAGAPTVGVSTVRSYKTGQLPLPLKEKRARIPQDQRRVELADDPKTEITEGSLRAALVEALREGRGSMTIEELSRELGRDARPVISKLEKAGWLRRM